MMYDEINGMAVYSSHEDYLADIYICQEEPDFSEDPEESLPYDYKFYLYCEEDEERYLKDLLRSVDGVLA
ncbi:hypothetical protein [Methanobrevibacter sp. DSM 116169]|uniref:hypothetical protein n=1 Tax=Methanobrevibacter sp. DSM 116169 TaxID=3242727 RepID=UPI0038FC7AF3